MLCDGSIRLGDGLFTRIGNVSDISFDDIKIPDYMSNMCIVNPASAELILECDVNADILKKLTGIDLARGNDMSCSMELVASPYKVQKRKHKKKRINKKWAKRYGYKTKFKTVSIQDCAFISKSEGYFDVTGIYERRKTNE
jgi:hypothetical protein